jgi:hypothetical protein
MFSIFSGRAPAAKYASASVAYPCDASSAAVSSRMPPSEPPSTSTPGTGVAAVAPGGRNSTPTRPFALTS